MLSIILQLVRRCGVGYRGFPLDEAVDWVLATVMSVTRSGSFCSGWGIHRRKAVTRGSRIGPLESSELGIVIGLRWVVCLWSG